jgi:hypothetical protein
MVVTVVTGVTGMTGMMVAMVLTELRCGSNPNKILLELENIFLKLLIITYSEIRRQFKLLCKNKFS